METRVATSVDDIDLNTEEGKELFAQSYMVRYGISFEEALAMVRERFERKMGGKRTVRTVRAM